MWNLYRNDVYDVVNKTEVKKEEGNLSILDYLKKLAIYHKLLWPSYSPNGNEINVWNLTWWKRSYNLKSFLAITFEKGIQNADGENMTNERYLCTTWEKHNKKVQRERERERK